MTPRERLIAVLERRLPDRVPVSPDVTVMMPVRYTRKPFWEILVNNNPPLWQAHISLQERFGYDMILPAGLESGPDDPPAERRIISKDSNCWVIEEITHTPKGDLRIQTRYYRNKSPWITKPLITQPEEEVDALLSTLTDPWNASPEHARELKEVLGERGILDSGISVPPAWWLYCRRDLSNSVVDFFDRTSLVEKAMDAYGEWALEYLQAACELIQPDLFLFSGSVVSMSVISPDLYRRYALPWLRKASEIAHGYGIFTGVHMCGRSKAALPILAESGVDLVEPLEALPGGDVTLAEVKKQFGNHFCLKGNVNTFETLAKGSQRAVKEEAKKVIDDAGEGGGLILATGDQVAGDTPEENFVALIETAQQYGRY